MNLYQPGLAVFSEWLNDIADVQDEFLLYSNPNADRAKTSYKEQTQLQGTSATNTANDNSKTQRECVLKDGQHPIWKCEKFKKMNVEERGQKAEEQKLCFKCLPDAHQMRNCSGRLATSMVAENLITDCYTDLLRTRNRCKMLKMLMRSLTCHQ